MIDQAFFREAYDADPDNQKLQKWNGKDGYLANVHFFYANPQWDGWQTVERQLLKIYIGLPTDEFSRIQQILMNLGKRIGAEWAKHDAARKVNSDDLGRFLQKLNDTVALEYTIEEIEKILDRKTNACTQTNIV